MRDENTHTNGYAANSGSPELLTIREAYQRLRISKWKLYDLIRTRKLATIQIGRRRLVAVDAIRSYLQQLAQESRS